MNAFFSFGTTPAETNFMHGSLVERWTKRFNNILITISGSVWSLPGFLKDIHERVSRLEKAQEGGILPQRTAGQVPLYVAPTMKFAVFPNSTAMYYGRKFLQTIADAPIGTMVAIDCELEQYIIDAAMKYRQAKGLRDWNKFPETAEEAAARCARDITQMGYHESGSTTDGVFIRAFRAENQQPHSWKPKERRSGHDRRIHYLDTSHFRRLTQRRKA